MASVLNGKQESSWLNFKVIMFAKQKPDINWETFCQLIILRDGLPMSIATGPTVPITHSQ